MSVSFLADCLVAVHFAYVAFVVFGQLAILIGWACGWEWVRNRWFRLAHLAAITIVALEALFGIDCPLTVWEDALRQRAGQTVTGGSFVGRWLHEAIFYDFDPRIIYSLHVGFAVLVFMTFLFVPPHWRRRTEQRSLTPPPSSPV
jgi:hypothetical protein